MGAKKIISLLLALSLLTGTVGSISACTPLAGEGPPQAETEKEKVFDESLLVTPEEPTEEGPISISFDVQPISQTELIGSASSNAVSGRRVTAKLTPRDAEDELDWSVAFNNPASAWATGKSVTDYVTVEPDPDDSHIATVYCLQAFGAKIIVKAHVRNHPEVAGTCGVEYLQPYLGMTMEFKWGGLSETAFEWEFGAEENVYVNIPEAYLQNTFDEFIESWPLENKRKFNFMIHIRLGQQPYTIGVDKGSEETYDSNYGYNLVETNATVEVTSTIDYQTALTENGGALTSGVMYRTFATNPKSYYHNGGYEVDLTNINLRKLFMCQDGTDTALDWPAFYHALVAKSDKTMLYIRANATVNGKERSQMWAVHFRVTPELSIGDDVIFTS